MAGPLETVFERGPAHVLGPHNEGIVYAFLASVEGTEAFRHKQLFSLRGVLNAPSKSIDLGPRYIGCLIPDLACRRLDQTSTHGTTLVISLGRAILRECHPLHEKTLFHGCISMERILLTEAGNLMIRDCGAIPAATMNMQEPISSTMPGLDTLFSTRETIPPEVLRGEDCSSHTDIFLIGALLYKLLVGRSPFSAPSTLARYHRISKGDYEPLGAEYGEFGEWVNQCLHPSPQARPTPQESRIILDSLDSPGSYHDLFDPEMVLISRILGSRKAPNASEPFLASPPEVNQALKLWDAQLLVRRSSETRKAPDRRWGTWIAVAFIAIVTWIFIEMITTEMRSQSYDGRPGPAPQELKRGDSPATIRHRVQKRRQLDRGKRIPRRDISL